MAGERKETLAAWTTLGAGHRAEQEKSADGTGPATGTSTSEGSTWDHQVQQATRRAMQEIDEDMWMMGRFYKLEF